MEVGTGSGSGCGTKDGGMIKGKALIIMVGFLFVLWEKWKLVVDWLEKMMMNSLQCALRRAMKCLQTAWPSHPLGMASLWCLEEIADLKLGK